MINWQINGSYFFKASCPKMPNILGFCIIMTAKKPSVIIKKEFWFYFEVAKKWALAMENLIFLCQWTTYNFVLYIGRQLLTVIFEKICQRNIFNIFSHKKTHNFQCLVKYNFDNTCTGKGSQTRELRIMKKTCQHLGDLIS